jgi:NTE family protein
LRRSFCGAAIAALALAGPPSSAAWCGAPGGPPRLGLVLSGGGARGIAHVGVLKALEEQGVRPDCIAGTSMGSLIGALYASGYPAARIEEIVRSVDWQRIYSGRAERPLVPVARRMEEMRPLVRLGFDFFALQLPRSSEPDFRLRRFLVALLTAPAVKAGRDFDRLPIPFRAVAGDLVTGARVVLGTGSLEAAVRASVSTPVTLEPVRDGSRWLVDGGIVDNMPIDVAREMGADVVVAVDVQSPPTLPGDESNVVQMAGLLADTLIRHRNQAFRAEADVMVSPSLRGVLNTDYEDYDRIMAAGYFAARTQAAEIRQALARDFLPAAATDGDAPGAATATASTTTPSAAPAASAQTVTAVRVQGAKSVHPGLVLEAFRVRSGRPFELPAALAGLDAVWATRLFRSAWLDVVPAPGGVEVEVHVRETVRRVVELSASYDEADSAAGWLRLRDLNVFGHGETLELEGRASEARSAALLGFSVDGLFGSPLGYFLRGEASEWRPRRFVDGEALPRASFDRLGVSGGLQTHPTAALLFRTRFERARVDTAENDELGTPASREEIMTVGGLVRWDRLDDHWEPTRGASASLEADHSVPGLGATHDYWRAQATVRWATALGRAGTLELGGLAFTSGGALPLSEQTQFGGPALAPGFPRDGLWAPYGGALALSDRIALVGRLRLVLRAGLSGTWDERSAISLDSAEAGFGVGLHHPTPLGPLELEWGHAQGRSQVYVSLGWR